MQPDENKMQGNIDWLKTYNLDLDDRVECDTIGCKRPATHYAQVKCCNAPIINCETCLHEAYKVVLWMAQHNKPVKCQSCHSVNPPKGWLSRPEKLSLL